MHNLLLNRNSSARYMRHYVKHTT